MVNEDLNLNLWHLSHLREMLLNVIHLGYTCVDNEDDDHLTILNVDVATKWLSTLKKALAETFVSICLPTWNTII